MRTLRLFSSRFVFYNKCESWGKVCKIPLNVSLKSPVNVNILARTRLPEGRSAQLFTFPRRKGQQLFKQVKRHDIWIETWIRSKLAKSFQEKMSNFLNYLCLLNSKNSNNYKLIKCIPTRLSLFQLIIHTATVRVRTSPVVEGLVSVRVSS